MHLDSLSRIDSPTILSAKFKSNANDFKVSETLSFEPSGEGEHLFLYIEKRNANTNWVAEQLAKSLGVKPRDVGSAGLKDRNGVTQQWFSIYWPGKAKPDTIDLPEGVELKEVTFNDRKLRKGAIKQNNFQIMLRDINGQRSQIEQQLSKIDKNGFPNFFGPQRFGHNGNNLQHAQFWLTGQRRYKRHQTSIYLSAMRSWFFNQWLTARIDKGLFSTLLPGDTVSLNGSRSTFVADKVDDVLKQRLVEGDIHIAGPMPGADFNLADAQPDLGLTDYWQRYLDCLQNMPKGNDYRASRAFANDMQWCWHENDLELTFSLPSGSYASSLLFALGSVEDASKTAKANRG